MKQEVIDIKDKLGALSHITKALGALTDGDPYPHADDALYWVSDEMGKIVIELEDQFKKEGKSNE